MVKMTKSIGVKIMTQCDQCGMSLWNLILIKESIVSFLIKGDNRIINDRFRRLAQWCFVFPIHFPKKNPRGFCALHPALSWWAACTCCSFKTSGEHEAELERQRMLAFRARGRFRAEDEGGRYGKRRHSCHSWSSLEKHEFNHTSSFYRILTDSNP